MRPLDPRSANSPHLRATGKPTPQGCSAHSHPANDDRASPTPNSSQHKQLKAAFLTTLTRRGGPAGAAAGRRVGQPGQMELGTQSGGQRVGSSPAYRGPQPLLPLQSARDSSARPSLTGQPRSQRLREAPSLPVGGRQDLHPANGAVTPHRLPAEHKGSHAHTLITGGLTAPTEPRSSVSPTAAGTTLSSQAVGRHGQRPRPGSKPQFQAGCKPSPTTPQPHASKRSGPEIPT